MKRSYVIVIVLFLSVVDFVQSNSNICGFYGNTFECCAGYRKDKQGECTIPVCSGNCGQGGYCIRPNTCYCANGRVEYSCDPSKQNNNPSNLNTAGGKMGGCQKRCSRRGNCVNDFCKCDLGYEGEYCEKVTEGSCYLNISRGVCKSSLSGLRLPMSTCCSAFEVAWGDRCQLCPQNRCQKGLEEIDGMCKDVDECKIQGICTQGQCSNYHGSFKCKCTSGFEYDDYQGDCVAKKDICDGACGANMGCQNVGGRPNCSCKPGFVKTVDQKSCVKKPSVETFDFCRSYGMYVCQFGKCMKRGNNYVCQCNPGYVTTRDQKTCIRKVDYCKLYENMLCTNGKCKNVDSTYECQCNSGYTPSSNKKRCRSICDLYNNVICPNGQCSMLANGESKCDCNTGYAPHGKSKTCRRIMNDPSQTKPKTQPLKEAEWTVNYCAYKYYKSQCKGGACVNLRNGYRCNCQPGFSSIKNEQACQKITSSENKQQSAQMRDSGRTSGNGMVSSYCDKYGSFLCPHGRCSESGSSYECICKRGYVQSEDRKTCTDANECEQSPGICGQGTCSNSPGSYLCSCYDGFTLQYIGGQPKCYDWNECEHDKGLCQNGQCVNLWGSYKCKCNSGFEANTNGRQCQLSNNNEVSSVVRRGYPCSQCRGVCEIDSSKDNVCRCSQGLRRVLNLGLCAPLESVVDIRFDVPLPSNTKSSQYTSAARSQFIYFDLMANSDGTTFMDRVVPQYYTVTLLGCHETQTDYRDLNGGPRVVCQIQEA